jgi:hypothetical protein
VILNEVFYHALEEQAIDYFVLSKETTDLQQRIAFVEQALMTAWDSLSDGNFVFQYSINHR